jgi:16S rRNA (uracil1498-N3)-methyltransferase
MPRIYLPALSVIDNRIVITGEKAHYLFSVLRCKKEDQLTIFDGKGICFRTLIERADKREVIAEVSEHFPCDFESPVHIILVQALLKGEKMDWVIQKTTELGVTEIMPVITERSQVRATRKTGRWRKIAEEASRQSGRSVVPIVHEPVGLKELLEGSEPVRQGEAKGFILWEDGGVSFNEAVKKISVSARPSIHLFIGPEGGFTKEEIALAVEKGFLVVSLGKRILRAETAALSAVTLVQFLLGDMGG